MQATYHAAIDRIIKKYEGDYGWNKKDRGGPTKYGITCYDLAEHRGKSMSSMTTWAPIVEAMQLSEAEDIYEGKYAAGLHYNDLHAGVDVCMLDYAINSGVARPVLVACELLHISPAHSAMTSALVDAINKADPAWFINAMCQERLAFMHGIRGGSDWNEFGHGWQARVDDVERYSKALAVNAPTPTAPDLSKVPTPKATHTDKATTKKVVAATAGTAPAATGAAHAAGAPPWAAIGIFAVICIAAAVGVFLLNMRAAKANATVILPSTIPPQPVAA